MASISGAELYRDIILRTGGDIYFGVVGPVRTGKSTFIKRFMELMVIPNIENGFERARVIDELPQCGSGRTVMTTQPKFVPNEAREVTLGEGLSLRVRMVDCVGFMADGALGGEEDELPRMVMTPWFDHEIPFNEAAELGTRRVITEHSTVGVAVLTDGSFTGIPRASYEKAEASVMEALQGAKKPFTVLLNSTHPFDPATQALAKELSARFGVPVKALNVLEMDEGDISSILESILLEFPLRTAAFALPRWLTALGTEHPLMKELIERARGAAQGLSLMRDAGNAEAAFSESADFRPLARTGTDLGRGSVFFRLDAEDGVFFRVLSEESGCEIADEAALIASLKGFADAKRAYDRVSSALSSADRTGYGLVPPDMDALELDEPEIVQQGGRFGVRLRARASGLHIIRVDIESEVSPLVGTAEQSEQLISDLTERFRQNPEDIWSTNIFGKSLCDLVREGMEGKADRLGEDVRMKLRGAVNRMVNEGCRGLVCIML